MDQAPEAIQAEAPQEVPKPVEHKAEAMAPGARQELTARAEGLRKMLAATEAKKQDAAGHQHEAESNAAAAQEGINRRLGQHDVLGIVRKEEAELLDVYFRRIGKTKEALAAIEAKLNNAT